MPRRLLIVATASVPAAELRASVRAHAGEDPEMLVLAPASHISRLDWLTNAEGDARTDGAGWLEKGSAETDLDRFHLPVTHLVVDDDV